jgi:hypothetical protein
LPTVRLAEVLRLDHATSERRGAGGLSMKEIQQVYIFVADNPPSGDEGIIGFIDWSTMTQVPMVTSNDTLLDQLRDQAREFSRQYGRKVRLVKFSAREVLEEL